MKKIFTLCGVTALVLFGAGAHAADILDTQCEEIAVGERGDVLVKCDASDALRAVQAETPNAKILSVTCDMIDCAAMAADTESIYVNIVENDCGNDTVGYRVVVQNPNFDEFYTVAKCM